MKLLHAAAALLALAPASDGAAARSATVPVAPDGWHEVTISVSDIGRWVEVWTALNGWELLYAGPLEPSTYAGFGSAEALPGRQALLRNPGSHTGYVRLLQFDGAGGEQIRPNAQSWDTGGWFDFNARAVDLRGKAHRLLGAGWQGYSEPVQFAFGPFVVVEWLARGPDGVVLALIERVSPPLEGWPHLRNVSRVFNATQVVADIETSYDFYVNALGFRVYLEHVGASESPGENVLGLPQNLASAIERRVYILHPAGTNDGSIELLQFDGADGRDLSGRTDPPNRGILSVRFAVADAGALHARLRETKVGTLTTLRRSTIPPYGAVRHFGLKGPSGEWLEFIEAPFGARDIRTP